MFPFPFSFRLTSKVYPFAAAEQSIDNFLILNQMKNKSFCPVMAVGTGNKRILNQTIPDQPKIPARTYVAPLQAIEFTPDDIVKLIEQIINKGARFPHFRKSLQADEGTLLEQKLYSSTYVKVMIRKTIAKMGDERRLGKGLRGFSRLLLQQIENSTWEMILLQLSLVRQQVEQKKHKQALNKLLAPFPLVCQ